MSDSAVLLDVFADGPGGGNPCPIVLDAADLVPAQMQDVARRHGRESGFVLAPTRPDADLRMRYFVPEHEMEMCVHATIAGLALRGTPGPVRVETPVGVVDALVEDDGWVIVEQLPPSVGPVRHDLRDRIAAALGCPPAYLPSRRDQPVGVSVSREKLLVEVVSPDALDGLQVDPDLVRALCDDIGTTGVYAWAPDGAGVWTARQFPRGSGYAEDPATGLAAAALGAFLALREPRDGAFEYAVRQGVALRRPSRIVVATTREGGAVTRVAVRGRATVADGSPTGGG